MKKYLNITNSLGAAILLSSLTASAAENKHEWSIDTTAEWKAATANSEH
ncbi:MAG: hypothetical protein HKP20_10675, partial [Akkermansiaceae bacterium]|nr:hypothetical protein [Akkermansiaceae bacterium]